MKRTFAIIALISIFTTAQAATKLECYEKYAVSIIKGLQNNIARTNQFIELEEKRLNRMFDPKEEMSEWLIIEFISEEREVLRDEVTKIDNVTNKNINAFNSCMSSAGK